MLSGFKSLIDQWREKSPDYKNYAMSVNPYAGQRAITGTPTWPSNTAALPTATQSPSSSTFGQPSNASFYDNSVMNAMAYRQAQKQALTGEKAFTPAEMEGISAGAFKAQHQLGIQAQETALKKAALEQQASQFKESLAWQKEKTAQELGWEQEKFGKTLNLQERQFDWNRSTWQQDYDLRYKSWETASKLQREQFEQNKYQFEKTYGFNYEQFLEFKREFDLKYELERERNQMAADKIDQDTWKNIASFAMLSPLMYAQMAKQLWNSKNPWEDLKKFVFGDDKNKYNDWVRKNYTSYDEDNPPIIEESPGGETEWGSYDEEGNWVPWIEGEGIDDVPIEPPPIEDVPIEVGGDIPIDVSPVDVPIEDVPIDISPIDYLGVSGGGLDQAYNPALNALTNTGGDVAITGVSDTASNATGSLPIVGGANQVYKALTQGPEALVNPGMVNLVAQGTAALAGLAPGMVVPGMGLAFAAGLYGMKQLAKGTGMGYNPFADPGTFASLGTFDPTSGAESIPFFQERMPDAQTLATRFKQQTGYNAPTSTNMPNQQVTYYQNWVAKQPEYQSAVRDWNQYVSDNWVQVPGDGDGQMKWMKREDYNNGQLTEAFGY